MLRATTTADSQAHYALAPDLVAAPRQNNRRLPRPVKRRLQILLVDQTLQFKSRSIRNLASSRSAMVTAGTSIRRVANRPFFGMTWTAEPSLLTSTWLDVGLWVASPMTRPLDVNRIPI